MENKTCTAKNPFSGESYIGCITCNPFLWIFIIISFYVTTINAALMYGLTKTTKKFKNPQVLQFLLALTDVVVVVFAGFVYVVPFYLRQSSRCDVVTETLDAMRNILFAFEPFLLAFIILCRYITIYYPFQDRMLTKVIQRKRFIAGVLCLFIFGCVSLTFLFRSTGKFTVIKTLSYVVFNFLCFLSMVIFNNKSIRKVRNDSKNASIESIRSIEKHKRAVKTLTLMTISTICSNLPSKIFILTIGVVVSKGEMEMFDKMMLYGAEFCAAIYLLGMGVNSQIFVCRSSKIMKLIKKKIIYRNQNIKSK